MNAVLRKLSTGKNVLILFILCNAVYVFMLLYSIPRVSAYASGMRLLDMMPSGYDYNYVQQLFTALGTEGRELYAQLQIPIDMLYPALFAFCYAFLMVWLLSKIKKHYGRLFYGAYLPFIAAAADYLENIGILVLLKQFPEFTRRSVEMLSRATVVKSSSTVIYFILLVLVLLGMGRRYYLKQKLV